MQTNKTARGLPNKPARVLPWRRILVPTDFSKTSLRAFDVAVPLARDCGARLCLLSVIEPAAYATGLEGLVIAVPDTMLVRDARAGLPRLARRFVPSAIPVTCWVKRGKAFDVITEVAQQKNIDLIVLASHGRTGFDRVLMGSTAERVVRHARCPVFVVRASHPNHGKQPKD
ncbi:MAG: universal stress protein [Verrucomicrobia bacterium]|jgi:nucleotide-binding universal stress UspA family protein|nr:universal stress protein [Verrucomicrobiota bacterium]